MRRVEFGRFNKWLADLPEGVADQVGADLDYATEFGAAAALPFVRHRIQISDHFPAMSETRSMVEVEGRRWVVRVLLVTDRGTLVCLGGDKAGWERTHGAGDWYEAHVPVADAIFRHMRQRS